MGLVKDAPHQDLTYQIIGAAIDVHNDLGPGHREEVYQGALASRFTGKSLSFADQVPLPVETDTGEVVLVYLMDFVVEQIVPVEIKAQSHPLTRDDLAQMIDYLAGSEGKFQVALLINFGRPRLEHRRQKWGKRRW